MRALIPEFLAAQKAADALRWDRAAERAAALRDSIYQVYLTTARTPDVRVRIERQAAMLRGQHER